MSDPRDPGRHADVDVAALTSTAKRHRDVRQLVRESRDKRQASRAHIYALEIPFSVIFGCAVGKAVDDHWGVAPWGISIGLLAGVGAAVRGVLALIAWQKLNDERDEREAAEDAAVKPPGES